MIYCSNCGKGIPTESKFCTFCGSQVPVINMEQGTADTPRVHTSPLTVAKPYNSTVATKNEFYKNVGFWGAVLLVAGFFLPFYQSVDMSLYDVVTNSGSADAGVFLWLVFPVSGAVLILQGITRMLPPMVANIFKFLPLLTLIFFLVAIFNDPERYGFFGDFNQFIEVAGIGLYGILLGTLLMLAFRRR